MSKQVFVAVNTKKSVCLFRAKMICKSSTTVNWVSLIFFPKGHENTQKNNYNTDNAYFYKYSCHLWQCYVFALYAGHVLESVTWYLDHLASEELTGILNDIQKIRLLLSIFSCNTQMNRTHYHLIWSSIWNLEVKDDGQCEMVWNIKCCNENSEGAFSLMPVLKFIFRALQTFSDTVFCFHWFDFISRANMHAFHASGGSHNHRVLHLRAIMREPAEEFGDSILDLCLFIQLGHQRSKSAQKQLHNALIWHLFTERKYERTDIWKMELTIWHCHCNSLCHSRKAPVACSGYR